MINDYSGFSLVLDSLKVSAQLPFQLIPDHWFRRAETEEITRIKEVLSTHRYAPFLYEYEITELAEGNHEGHSLPPDQWRYYVISFSPTNDKLRDVEYAANLLKNDISLGYFFFAFGVGASGVGYDMAQISTFFGDRHGRMEIPKSITDEELGQITTNYNLITGLDKTRYPNVSRAISDFHQTKMITDRSLLKILSYFSIIECLLTHQPHPSDTMDSLTRQITNKMLLLSKRFDRALPYKLHFPSITEPDKTWRKLYQYRSVVAHGGKADFGSTFKTLVSRDKIREFLIEGLKLLLLYALKEPELLADLQKC